MVREGKRKSGIVWTGKTLPDYLCPGLDIVFVGLNPGLYSAEVGHYFAHKQNRFWPALSASGLVPELISPESDSRLPDWGLGLTDIVKRPTSGIHELTPSEFRRGAKALEEKIEYYNPRIVCFVGFTGYHFCCGKEGGTGRQEARFGGSHVFVIPSTSPRNAHYSLATIITALRDLKEYRDRLGEESIRVIDELEL